MAPPGLAAAQVVGGHGVAAGEVAPRVEVRRAGDVDDGGRPEVHGVIGGERALGRPAAVGDGHPDGGGDVPAGGTAGDDDAVRVDAQRGGVLLDPVQGAPGVLDRGGEADTGDRQPV